MPKFRNVSPLGALDLPLIGRVVEPREVIVVSAAQAEHLKGQEDTWRPVPKPKGKADSTASPAEVETQPVAAEIDPDDDAPADDVTTTDVAEGEEGVEDQ